VKAVIDNHNGRIWLDSDVQQGTTFHVMLPAVRAEQA
jgi:signal transduction histidine kinase